MQAAYHDSRYSWSRLGISIAASAVVSVGMWSAVLVLPNVQTEFGVDRADASIAYTMAMAGFAAGNLLLGRLVDRYGIAPVLAIAGMVQAATFALSSLAGAMWVFAALQFIIGLTAAAGFGPMLADISHWFLRRRGIAVAAAACGNYLAGSIWPQLLKSTIETGGWRPAFLTIAIIGMVTILPLTYFLRRRLPEELSDAPMPASPSMGGGDTGLSPRTLQILLAVAGIGCCVAMAMPQVHIVAYSTDLGFGISAGAQMLSIMLGAGIISRLLSGFIADTIGGVRTLLIGSVLQCMALFLYIPFNSLMSLYVVSLIFGLAQGGIVPSYAIIVREFLPAREAGQRVGLVIMATVVGMAFGGWLSGWIYDLTGSYRMAFINGIAWNMMNIGIGIFLLSRSRRVAAA